MAAVGIKGLIYMLTLGVKGLKQHTAAMLLIYLHTADLTQHILTQRETHFSRTSSSFFGFTTPIGFDKSR